MSVTLSSHSSISRFVPSLVQWCGSDFARRSNRHAKSRPHSSHNRLIFLCAVLLLLGLSLPSNAQTVTTTDGFTPNGMAAGAPLGSYLVSDFERINYHNGRLSAYLPLVRVGGRGEASQTVGFNATAGNTGVQVNLIPAPPPTGGFSAEYSPYEYGEIAPLRNYGKSTFEERGIGSGWAPDDNGFGYFPHYITLGLIFKGPDGTEYDFIDQNFQGSAQVVLNQGGSVNFGKVFYSSDDGRITYVSDFDLWMDTSLQSQPMSGTMYLPDGTRYRINWGLLGQIIDRNGNTINFDYDTSPHRRLTSITDSLNRQVTFAYNVNMGAPYGTGDMITYKGFGGATRTIRITMVNGTLVPGSLYPQLGGPVTNHFTGYTETVWLPDDRQYVFRHNEYGHVDRIELPTGGAIEYDYAPGVRNGPASGVIGPWQNHYYTGEAYWIPGIYRRVVTRRVYKDKNSPVYESRQEISRPESINPSLAGVGEEGFQSLEYVEVTNYDYSGTIKSYEVHHFPTNPPVGPPRATPYHSLVQPTISWKGWADHQETKFEVFDTNGTTIGSLLRKVEHKFSPYFAHVDETTTTFADTNQVSKQTFLYDDHNNLTDVYEHDFGDGAAPTYPVKHTHTDYLTINPVNNVRYDAPRPIDPTALPVHIRTLPKERKIYSVNSTNGVETLIADTVYEYDNYVDDARHKPLVPRGGITGHDSNFSDLYKLRGNLTGTTAFANAIAQSGPVVVSTQYDIAGNAVAIVDAGLRTSTNTFSDSFCNGSSCGGTFVADTFAFLTSATSPIPDPQGQHGSATALVSSTIYDFWTSKATSTTDANNQTTSFDYVDVLDRLKAVIRPSGGGRTDYEYGDTAGNLFVRTLVDLDTSRKTQFYQYFDGLGRSVEVRRFETATSFVTKKQEYDALGRINRSYNAYRTTTESTYGWTDFTYDALGRTKKVETFDKDGVSTGAVTSAFSGNTTMATDPSSPGKRRISRADALGQLTDVWEITAADPPETVTVTFAGQSLTGYLTHYDYDVLGNLTKITSGSHPQRTFAYNSLGRMTDSTNPENGHLTFDYYATGQVFHRTDARGVVTTYEYDNLDRMISRSYSNGAPTVSYTYDAGTNARGRSSTVSSSVSTYTYSEYDALGRVKAGTQATDGQSYLMEYSYNLGGGLESQKYPSGKIIKSEYDDGGNVAGIRNDGASWYFVGAASSDETNRIQYTPHGSMKVIKFGNGLWEHRNFNSRQQVTEIGLGISSTSSSLLQLDYSYGTSNNNGNLQSQTITAPGLTLTQSYTYDLLNRLESAVEMNGSNQTWRQVYTYDRNGNRRFGSATTVPDVTPPNENTTNPAISTDNNRITTAGYRYDSAGNLECDPLHPCGSSTPFPPYYTYDGENRIASANGGTVTYSYDGDGRRVKKVVGTVVTIYVYNFTGQLIAEYTTSAPAGDGGTKYFSSDNLGTPRVVTGSNAAVLARHDYLPFGEEIATSLGSRNNVTGYSANDPTRQRFTAKERDSETGLDFFVSRYFSSTYGRFTSADSIVGKRNNPQTLNRYTYVTNNPLRFVDPFGYQQKDPKDEDIDKVIIYINDAEQQRKLKEANKALGPIKPSPNPFDWTAMPSRLCVAGVCGGKTIGETLTDAAIAGDRMIGNIQHRVKQAIPDGVQLNVTALFVISLDWTVTPDGDVFGGIDIPILSGWTDALSGATKGRALTPKSGLGASVTGIYIIDPAVRDFKAEGEIRLGQSGAQDVRRSYFNGTSYTLSGCYYLCGGGQQSSGRNAMVLGAGTPGVFAGASQSTYLYHIPIEKLPNPFKYLPR